MFVVIVQMVSEHRLVNMLTTLLSSSLDKEKKKKKLQEEFELPMSVEFEQITRVSKTIVLIVLEQCFLPVGVRSVY